MKQICLLFVLLVPIAILGQPKSKIQLNKKVNSQVAKTPERCTNTFEWHEHRMQNDINYRERMLKREKALKERTNFKNPDCSTGPIIIPLAVHFAANVVQPDEEACMINLVIDQIASLNAQLNGNDPTVGSFAPFVDCFGPNTVEIGVSCVELCIGQSNHPTGYGVDEGELAITFGQINFNNTAPFSSVPLDANWAGYLNIYVDDLGGGLLGESSDIGGDFVGDGVIVDDCTFGTGDINCPGVNTSASCGGGVFNLGKTLVHEVGHYLGLLHIFQGGCSAQNDGISDTPAMNSSYNGDTSCGNDSTCPNLPVTCGTADMYMNYMAYTGDACMYMLTSGQADRIFFVVDNLQLFGDTIPNACKPAGPPTSNFSFIAGEMCPGECIPFTDESNSTPNSWTWAFSVLSGDIVIDISSSMDQNPMVCVTAGTAGMFEATLTASNDMGPGTTSTQTVDVSLLDAGNINCGIACGDFAGGPYIDFIFPNICEAGCPIIIPNFEVWENEAYILFLEEGLNYTFEFCNGYDAATWPAIITLSLFDPAANTAFPNSAIQAEAGCSMDITAPITTLYLLSITGNENCGGAENQTDNGILTFTCNNVDNCPCPTVFQDKGNGGSGNYGNNETTNNEYLFCPNMPDEVVQAEFTDFNIEEGGPTGCYDHMEVYDGPDTASPQIGLLHCGTTLADAPGGGTVTSTHSSGCLTFVFTSDASVTRLGWVANINCIMAPIPVELIDFTARAGENQIKLQWSTASEINNEGFEIWRKSDDTQWENIGWVNAQGNGSAIQFYEFSDSNVRKGIRYYYQLNQKDYGGRSTLSNIETVELSKRNDFKFNIYPNPLAETVMYFESTELAEADMTVVIYDVIGKVVDKITWSKNDFKIQLNLSHLKGGIYFSTIKDSNQRLLKIEKLIKY